MKKFIAGLVTGVIIAITVPATAEVTQYVLKKVSYPVVVNDRLFQSEKLPILNYEGSTYVPLKSVGDLLGADVQWNAKKAQVEIKGVDTVSGATD